MTITPFLMFGCIGDYIEEMYRSIISVRNRAKTQYAHLDDATSIFIYEIPCDVKGFCMIRYMTILVIMQV